MDAVQLSGKSSGGKIIINREANGIYEVCCRPLHKPYMRMSPINSVQHSHCLISGGPGRCMP